jgi:hypothetical protein
MREQIQLIGMTPEDLCALISESVSKHIDNLVSQNEIREKDDTNELLTRKETADLFGVSFATINTWQNSRILKVYKMGNRSYFKRSEVLKTLYDSNFE